MVLFDTHAHYDDSMFDADRESLLDGLPDKDIGLVMNAGCDVKSSLRSIEIARRYDFIYAAVGIHPNEAMGGNDLDEILKLAKEKKVAAIGEIGLDYHYDDTSRDIQKKIFEDQLDIAMEIGLPVIIHSREAHSDSLEAVKRHKGIRGVFHNFSGSVEMARELVSLGFHISFAGPVTYSGARKPAEAAKSVPDDRILIETDCPYLTPVPYRGTRNDSGYMIHTARKIAEIRAVSVEELCEKTYMNGRRLFGI